MRYYQGLSYSLVLHEDAEADLDRIYEADEDAAADIDVFLEEAKNNQETLDNLTRNGFVQYGEWPYEVKEWVEAKKSKYNLWRVRLLWLEGPAAAYRIVYAFHPIQFRYYVLGIVERTFNYDSKHERTQQIIAAYDALNLPRN